MNISSLDLNLLVALKALLEESHVTRAAERIGLSQPAMSRALGRLRKLFNDPLLVRGASGRLTLTTRASELQQPLQAVFNEIDAIISPPATQPAEMQKEIIIATRDNEMVSILPELINYSMQEAPGISFRIIPLTGDDLSLLERQEIDFILAGTESNAGSLHRQTLYKEDFVCLVSEKNPIAKQELTLEKFLSLRHCMVTISGFGPGFVDTTLSQKGLSREIAVRLPHFLAAGYMVAESNLIVTLPRKLGMILAKHNKLVLLEPPIKIPSFSIYLYWHARNHNNPIHKWLRKILASFQKK